jgi:hypothetical protein
MQKHKLTPNGKEAYWDLFVNRDDVYAVQHADGTPHKVNAPLTPDVLFDENENIGAYQLNKDNKVKFAVLDIDLVKKVHSKDDFKIDDWFPVLQKQTRIALDLLKQKGIDTYVEFSGFKGYHVWIFFKSPMDAGPVRKWMHDVFDPMPRVDDAIAWEIFPKQDKLNVDGTGNYVKPPLQIHKKSGQWSTFVDDQFNEMDLDLSSIIKVSPQLDAPAKTYDLSAEGKLDIEKWPAILDRCAWLQRVIADAESDNLTGTMGHEKRLALASILHPFGEKGYIKLTEILSNLSDYDPDVTRKHWESIDKPPHTCERLCKGDLCANITRAGGKSPIKFAYEKLNGNCFVKERENCYYKKANKSNKYEQRISTFVIEPKELLVLEESDCLVADVYSNSGHAYKDIKLENIDWHTRQKFLKAIGHQDCIFTGSDNDLQELCSYVNERTPVRKTGTKVIGLVNNVWVIQDVNITSDGPMRPMRIVPYERGSDAYYHKIRYKNIEESEKKTFLKKFYHYITRINDPEVIFPIIGWVFAAPFKSLLTEKLDGFPLLFIHGGQGSGKSTTGSLFLRIAGYQDAAPNSCTMRPFPMLKLLSSNNGIPVILDEFKVSDMRSEHIDNLFRYMRSSYRGEVEQKGRADQTVEEYQLSAPLALMGEWNISQPALRERMILVRFSDIIKKTDAMQKAYQRVKELPLEGFLPLYIEYCLNQDLDKLIRSASNIVRCNVAPRIRNNMITMIIGLQLFKGFVTSNGIDIGDLDYDSLISSQVENIIGNSSGFVKSAVDQLIEELEVMAMNGDIEDHVDYVIDKQVNGYLAIAFNYLYPKFKSYASRTGWDGELLDMGSYTSLFRECDYIVDKSKVVNMTPKSKRCILVDMKKAEQRGLSFEGFKQSVTYRYTR